MVNQPHLDAHPEMLAGPVQGVVTGMLGVGTSDSWRGDLDDCIVRDHGCSEEQNCLTQR